MPLNLQRRRALSVLILGAAILIAASPWTPFRRRLLVAIGSELEQPMHELEVRFETTHPAVDLQWRVLGSQDMVNQALDASPARPRVLIPASEELLQGLADHLLQLGVQHHHGQLIAHAIDRLENGRPQGHPD